MSDCRGTSSEYCLPRTSSPYLVVLLAAAVFGCAGNSSRWVEDGVRRGTIVVTRGEGGVGYLHTYKDLKKRVVRVEHRLRGILDHSYPIEHREYDTGGRLSAISFTDHEGSLTVGPDGFAKRRSGFETTPSGDLLLSYSYFDSADEPMMLVPGHFREESLFRKDVIQRVRYFDPDGKRVVVALDDLSGVHEIRYFHLKGVTPITMETLFDESGKPISKRQLSGSTQSWSSVTRYYRYGRGTRHGHAHVDKHGKVKLRVHN